jgi:hypothetical protein
MKTAQSPIEVWNLFPDYRNLLKHYSILDEKDWEITIPAFKCSIDKNWKTENRFYPYYHQKMLQMLEACNYDVDFVMSNWRDTSSFCCGADGSIVISLL